MAVYGKLKVPEFKPWEAKKAQGKYFDLIDETSGQAGAAVQKINDTNQAELTRLMEQSLGPGYAETWGKGMRTLGAQAEGRFTDEQETMYRNIYTAKAQQMGLSGSGAGLNLKVSGLGREGVRMQQQALATMPGFMQGMRQNLMATPTRVESMFIPSSSMQRRARRTTLTCGVNSTRSSRRLTRQVWPTPPTSSSGSRRMRRRRWPLSSRAWQRGMQ